MQISTNPSDADPLQVRPYRNDDAAATLAIFIAAITVTAANDYSPAQVSAWARPEQRNVSDWHRGMIARESFVAVIGDEIAGFSDVSANGYIDMMFVAPHFARRGVATALISLLESRARSRGVRQLSADVSITARPFFESQGFEVEAIQHPITAGVHMTNFRMTRSLIRSS